MKSFIHYLLLALIVIPSLACAMPCRVDMSEMNGMHEDENTHANGMAIMLIVDCINIDFDQAQNNVKLEEPSFKSYPALDPSLYDLLVELQSSRINLIRGPPYWALSRHFTPPLILTTQRFRI